MRQSLGMSSEAVQKKTGRTWEQWISTLDRDGCSETPHKEIAEYLANKYQLGAWWSQTVAIGYERAHGRRTVNQKSSGDYAVSVTKTFPVSIDRLYLAWNDDRERSKWLGDETPKVTSRAECKSLRMKWTDDKSAVSVRFTDKGPGKSSVTVQHEKLSRKGQVDGMRKYWSGALDRLAQGIL